MPLFNRCVLLALSASAIVVVLGCTAEPGGMRSSAESALGVASTLFGSSTPRVRSDPDNQAVSLGVKFKTTKKGQITGLRFYKGSHNLGTHTGTLWTASGQKLARVTFTNESASGWQSALFKSPVGIAPGVVYVASYFAPVGRYAADTGYFSNGGHTSSSLFALGDSELGGNGAYIYGEDGFPTQSYQASNYYVDVLFSAAVDAGSPADDAGSPNGDSGTPNKDAGTPPVDSGTVSTTDGGFTVNCPLTAEGESCWAQQTGVLRGSGYTEAQILAGQSNLVHHVGDLTITTDGTVIDHQWIDGCISIHANNVTIKNSLIHTQNACAGGDNDAAGAAINTGASSASSGAVSGLLIQDTEIDGMNPPEQNAGVGAQGYRCVRCNVHGFNQNFWLSMHASLVETYSHDLNTFASNPCIHSETVDADSATNVSVEHSYLRATGTVCVTAAFMNGSSWGPSSNVVLDSSYLEGVDGADVVAGCGATNIRYTNNAFSSNNGYNSSLYIYGFNPSGAGVVWSGNLIPETGKTLVSGNSCQ